MAHYAELSPDNVVLNVLYVTNDIITDENDNEVESLGVEHLQRNIDPNGRYVRTSYNANIRGKYAGVGDLYHTESDKFYNPQPFPSWTLNTDTLVWEPPIPQPAVAEGEIPYAWNQDMYEADNTKGWDRPEEPAEESE